MKGIEYTIRYSRRKSIAITIDIDGNIVVKAPQGHPRAFIDGYVSTKRDWIEKTLAKTEKLRAERDAFTLDVALLLGEEYPVRAVGGKRVYFTGKRFEVPQGDRAAMMQSLREWYRGEAKELLPRRVAVFAQPMGLSPRAVRITNARTRWGSCSTVGNLNFSWKLMMAPGYAVDYVVIHELAHLREPNHSQRFWRIVGRVMPDYARAQACLKELQQRLVRQGWE